MRRHFLSFITLLAALTWGSDMEIFGGSKVNQLSRCYITSAGEGREVKLASGEHTVDLPLQTAESFQLSFCAEVEKGAPRQTFIDMPDFLSVKKTLSRDYGEVLEARLTLCDSVYSSGQETRTAVLAVPLSKAQTSDLKIKHKN